MLALSLFTATAAFAAPRPATDAEVRNWLRHLLPLPKEIEFRDCVTVPLGALRLSVRPEGSALVQAAVAELKTLLGEQIVDPGHPDSEFTLAFFVGDTRAEAELPPPGVERLTGLPNRDQSYLIEPASGSGLTVVALGDRGLYYGCKTLQQLLRPGIGNGQVTIPLALVRDWPDLAERGEWGGSANADIEWMAERKMNLVESHVDLSIDEQGRGVARLDEELLERGRAHAVKVVPIITHLDQLGGSGIYTRYPELKGVGKTAQGTWSADQVAPCFSQPRTAEIIADWFLALSRQPGVTDICAWLSEEHLQCGCEACQKEGQYVLEAKAAVRAWRLARDAGSTVGLRILLTQGSYPVNDQVLAAVPPEIGISYYDGGRTYDSSRDPMIYPLLEEYTKQGRWLGCYPQLTASWRIVCPWSGPQFIRYRMTEFVQDGLQCLCGYATPNNKLYDLNVQAAAEWSWNSGGRDERELAAAWATREGLRDPGKAADWAVTLGPVGWDVYGSGVPYPHFFGRATSLIAQRGVPKLGEGMFRYFPTLEHMDDDLAACQEARKLAEALEAAAILGETDAVTGYVGMIAATYRLASAVAGKQTLSAEEQQQVQTLMDDLDAASRLALGGLGAWEDACGDGIGGGRFADTLNVTERTCVDIAAALAPLGITDPGGPFRPRRIGAWESEDFTPDAEQITKRWEITEALSGTGTYRVRFDYVSGWWGLSMGRVAIASAPPEAPETLTEVVTDEHPGIAAYEDKANTYSLALDQQPPGLRYFVVADIKGVTSEGKPENRRGCTGEVWMWKVRPEEAR